MTLHVFYITSTITMQNMLLAHNVIVSFFSRFTDHAYQYASTQKATSTPLGCFHSYHPHPQCLACAFATLTHPLPGARPGRKLPLLTTGALSGFSDHETTPAEDHPAGAQCECCTVHAHLDTGPLDKLFFTSPLCQLFYSCPL